MQRTYDKWYSRALGREMELLRFGWSGFPVIVFPTSMGRFYQYEDMGLVARLDHKLEQGWMQLFCVDSVDAESWYNQTLPPARRAPRHDQYDAYLCTEVLPFIRARAQRNDLGLFGCSFGAFHAANFAVRHPGLVTKAVCLSGVFDVRRFTDGYWDDADYRNSPADVVADIQGEQLERVRRVEWTIATGEFDSLIDDNRRFDAILTARNVSHHTEIWPGVTGHDWPFWNDAVVRLL